MVQNKKAGLGALFGGPAGSEAQNATGSTRGTFLGTSFSCFPEPQPAARAKATPAAQRNKL